jgi:hypothetical protein
MKRRSTPSSIRSRRGTTLIEVLAGLLVLGTLLVSVAMARARFMRQAADAERSIRATRAADALLATWLTGSTPSVPAPAEGPLQDTPDFVWRTRVIRDPAAARLDAVIVRFEVFNRLSESASPVLAIDLLQHRRSS